MGEIHQDHETGYEVSKVVDERVVMFEVELSINYEYVVYYFEARLDERPTP